MFKFEYKMINKYDVSNKAGFSLIIDSEYNYIEYFLLDNKSNITNRKVYKISLTKVPLIIFSIYTPYKII